MNVSRRLIAPAALTGVLSLALSALSGCSLMSTTTSGHDDGGRFHVVASFYPMEYLAKTIGGDHVVVTDLTKPGVEPHDLEISPRQTADLERADMVLYLKGLQPAVDEAVGQSGVRKTVDATRFTTLEDHGTEVGHAHGGDHGHAEQGHEGGDGQDAAADPHVWLDPVRYAQVAEGVGRAMAKADPGHAATYRKNSTALVDTLENLDRQYRDGLKNRSTDTFITNHSAFGYLAERYGLEQEAVSGLDPESEPSPARRKQLEDTARRQKVTTVFFETIADDRTARTLAADTGLKTDVLDPIEGVTHASQGHDYVEIMRSNLANLKKALGAG